jgi:hypothetical protein
VWSGALTNTVAFSPPSGWTVNRNTMLNVNFSWSDAYGNRLSVDSPSITAQLIGSMLGGVSIMNVGLTGDQLGSISLFQDTLEATETAPGSGVFNIVGPCSPARPGPTDPLTRCIRQIRFGAFGSGNTGVVTLTGRTTMMPDGGPPPAAGTLRMTSTHGFSTSVTQDFPVTFQ